MLDDKKTILLIDSLKDHESLNKHHKSEIMNKIMELRNKYDLYMKVEKYILDDSNPQSPEISLIYLSNKNNKKLINIDEELICWATGDPKHQGGVDNKKDRIKSILKDGHVYRKLNSRGKKLHWIWAKRNCLDSY